MKYSTLILTLLMFCITGRSQVASGREDRAYWISILSQVSDPLLNNMSKGELRKNMPVETVSGAANPSNARTTHLEALGRLLVGIAPWLELGPDETSEGQLREKYIQLMLKSIEYGFDPESPDYLNFTVTRQPLVDAAFFCQGVLRAPVQVWSRLSPVVRQNVLNALQQIRNIKPVESNWLLFSAMVEAALLELTGECNMYPIEYAVMRFKEWYKGETMATIKTAIMVQDSMSPALRSMSNACRILINNFEDMQTASSNPVDVQSLKIAKEELNNTNMILNQIEQSAQNANNETRKMPKDRVTTN